MEEEYLKKYYVGDINEALKQLKQGLPVQYIVGSVNFYGLNFKVNNKVLIPRFETEELVSKTIKYIAKLFNRSVSILDIGTGSGCIAITLNKKIDCVVDAIDISKDALDVARENNDLNGTCVNFFESDLLKNIDGKYDVIISNPPYIREDEEIMEVVKNNEPNIALFAKNEGLYFYEEILKNINKNISEKYFIAFEIGQTQGEKVKQIALKYLPNARILLEQDLNKLDRYIFIYNSI